MGKSIEAILAQVSPDRRGFLKALLVGSAIAVVPIMTTEAMAQDGDTDAPGGKGKGKGKGKSLAYPVYTHTH